MIMGSGRARPGFIARHKALVALLGLMGLLFAGVGAWAVSLSNQIASITRVDVDLDADVQRDPVLGTYRRPAPPTGPAAESLNILIGGVDAGESSDIIEELGRKTWVPGSHRSDTIMVLHISADRKRAYVISVPRDSWVPIDGHGMSKINAAMSWGGPALFVRTMEQFTGLRMDHLVLIDWHGFRNLVDALGGVKILQPGGGDATMDGETALEYVRERRSLPKGDLDRVQRQQNVIRALSTELVARDTLVNPVRLTEVLGIISDSVAVDQGFSLSEMRELALSLRDLDADEVRHLTVPVDGLGMVGDQSVVFVDVSKARKMFRAATKDKLESYMAQYPVDSLPAPAAVD